MPNYATLDMIADAVNPSLGLLALAALWLQRPRQWRRALILNLLTIAAVGIAYLGQAFDAAFRLWPRHGLDYSTHMAVFTALGSSFWRYGWGWRCGLTGLAAAYVAWMLWQAYHSFADILSIPVVMTLTLAVYWSLTERLAGAIRATSQRASRPPGTA